MNTTSWTPYETETIISFVEKSQVQQNICWDAVAASLGTGKSAEECRFWIDFLQRAMLRLHDLNSSEFAVSHPTQSYNTTRSSSSDSEPAEADYKIGVRTSPDAVSAQKSRSSKLTTSSNVNSSENKPKAFRPRRTANQIARLFCCPHAGCDKRYGSEGALKGHIRIKHPDVFPEYQRLRVEAPMQIIVPPTDVTVAPVQKKTKKRKSRSQDTESSTTTETLPETSFSGEHQRSVAAAFGRGDSVTTPLYHKMEDMTSVDSSSLTSSPRSSDEFFGSPRATSQLSGESQQVYFNGVKYENTIDGSLEPPAPKRRVFHASGSQHEMQHMPQDAEWEEYPLADGYPTFYQQYDIAAQPHHVVFHAPQHAFSAETSF